MTVEELLALPEDGVVRELFDGEVVEMAPPTNVHQYVLTELLSLLHAHVKSKGLGRVYPARIGVKLGLRTYLEPDLIFVPASHPEAEKLVKIFEHPPALVVEILSPSNSIAEMVQKTHYYAAGGVKNVWIVDCQRDTIEAMVLEDGGYAPVYQTEAGKFSAEPFADLQISVAGLFPAFGKGEQHE